MELDDRIHSLTTLIIVNSPPLSLQGTGFFYHVLAPKDPSKDAQWREVKEIWLVTNRHILLPRVKEVDTVPAQFTFHLRIVDSKGKIDWLPVNLNRAEIKKRAKVYLPSVDVALVRIEDLITGYAQSNVPIAFSTVGEDDFPGANKLNVEVTSDIIVAGYPRGFYDNFNKFPIVKAGIIASRWLAPFQGEPKFLIDAKLFPGSSGSIVLSKPVNSVIEKGQLFTSKEKRYCFLGVFSGEPYETEKPVETDDMIIIQKQSFDVGYVWYYYLVPEIIKKGSTV